MHLRLLALLAAGTALCAGAASSAEAAAVRCGVPGYSYAGVASAAAVREVAATVTALRTPRVQSGHVAAWVGVGGFGLGPGGADQWIQAGLVAAAGGRHRLYVEWKRPGHARGYVEVAAGVPAGSAHRVAVRELTGRPSVWRAFVDGRAAGPAVRLRRSHGRLPALATAESWDGGRPSCNRFAYRFAALAVAPARRGASAAPALVSIEDPGYRVEQRERATFVARSYR